MSNKRTGSAKDHGWSLVCWCAVKQLLACGEQRC